MMNRFIYLFLLLGCSAWALVGCTGDPDVEPHLPVDGDGSKTWVTIDLGDNSFDEVHITTRATLDNVAESRVNNLFVFIFNSAGERLYGRYFDPANRVDSKYNLQDSKNECWYVEGNASETEPEGRVRIFAPKLESGSGGGYLYLLANVNADMVNVSPEKLRFVQTLDELETMTASLNQQITERNGFFPMTGWANVESITNSSIKFADTTLDTYESGHIMLTRLDAKVEVKLRVAKGYKATNPETKTVHTIQSFVPLSWQVVNLPRTSFVLPRNGRDDARDGKGKKDLFNTREVKFETRKSEQPISYKDSNGNDVNTTTDVHGFSFYMLENRPNLTGKSKISELTKNPNTNPNDDRSGDSWRYHLRDTRRKNAAGAYLSDPNGTGDIWQYAPAEGTYLILKGEVVMSLDVNEPKDQQLSADAVYYIHLGDFASSVDNYDIERNTSYTYMITIYGVDNIEIEVVKQKEERESGATGHVYVAKEKIFTFDSHFGCEVVSFDAEHLTNVDDMTWYVRSPFGREGKPHVVNGVEVPAGLDYQWVKFKRNSFTTDEHTGEQIYSELREKYDPASVKNVLDFSKYIKEQKQKLDAWKKALAEGKTAVNETDFRLHFDKDWLDWYNETNDPDISEADARQNRDGVWYRNRIYLTIFVDEYYYDANPLTGDVRQDLWKEFVNQPDRLMHILCDADKSADEASLSTGSVVTIRQHSIQTIFNTQKPELKTAWGCETTDETRDKLWYFSRQESFYNPEHPNQMYIPADVLVGANQVGNTSPGNGLYNTARIWGLVNGSTYTPKLWSNYVDPNNTKTGLRGGADADEIETLRYSCMTRNRDENGDDRIDAKEVKWYMAAISQLGSLYVGDQGLSTDAVLYPYYKQAITDKSQAPSDDDTNDKKYGPFLWRSHIVSSTLYDDDNAGMPEVLWAEEGLSTGRYNDTWGKYAGMSVRCVRNLGMDPTTEADAQAKIMDENNISAVAIDVTGPGLGDRQGETVSENSVYTFDMTNLNPLSIRYYTSQELEPNNEFSVEAKVYWAFETGILTGESYSYTELYNTLRDGRSPCPDGYRTPNVREAALMSLRIDLGENNKWQPSLTYSLVSTYYSHGKETLETDNGPVDVGTGQDSYANNDAKKPNHSWLFDTQRVRLDQGDKAKIRCVRDIRQ